MGACTGSSACARTSLEEKIRYSSLSTLVRARHPLTNSFTLDAQFRRWNSRCEACHVFWFFAHTVFDAAFRAAAGEGLAEGPPIVEPIADRAPSRGTLRTAVIRRRLTLVDGPAVLLLTTVARMVPLYRWMVVLGAHAFLLVAALLVLARSACDRAAEWPTPAPPAFLYLEDRFSSRRPSPAPGAVRWRAADHPIRHTLRMAAWNSTGWPAPHRRRPAFVPGLDPIREERRAAELGCGDAVREEAPRLPLDRPRQRPPPPISEEERADTPPSRPTDPTPLVVAVTGGTRAGDAPAPVMDHAPHPTSGTADAVPPLELRNRFASLEVWEAEGAQEVFLAEACAAPQVGRIVGGNVGADRYAQQSRSGNTGGLSTRHMSNAM